MPADFFYELEYSIISKIDSSPPLLCLLTFSIFTIFLYNANFNVNSFGDFYFKY